MHPSPLRAPNEFRFLLLGPLEARDREGRQIRLGGPKVRGLLAMLLLSANEVVPVERIIDALWQEQPVGSTRQSVHFLVHRLRRALAVPGDQDDPGAAELLTRQSGYLLTVDPSSIDASRFEATAHAALADRAAGRTVEATAGLAEALALWRGPVLAGMDSFMFVQEARVRLEELRGAALIERIEADMELGGHAELVAELEALVRASPFNERLRAQLVLALYRSGRSADALSAYRSARAVLVEELGIEPGPGLQHLERAILTHDPDLDPRPGAGGHADRPGATAGPGVVAGEPGPPSAGRSQVSQVDPPATAEPVVHEERRLVTVLYVLLGDVAPRLDPEDAGQRGARVLTRLRAAAERFGGTVSALAGGAALAVFGAVRARDDDPERGVRAALELAGAGPRAEAGQDRAGLGGLAVRVGVATGQGLITVVEPADGSASASGEGPVEPDVGSMVGAVVEQAQALAQAAAPGTVLATPATRSATQNRIDYQEGTGGWRALQPRSRVGGTVTGQPGVPLVERDTELALLANLFARARARRRPHLATLIGLPGIGKTRLIGELARLVEADQELITWRQGRSVPEGDGIAFPALGEIVKAHAGILDTDAPDQAQAKLTETLVDAFGDADEASAGAPRLLPLVRSVPRGEPDTNHEQLLTAWHGFIQAIAAQRPLVLVFEDLHWAHDALLEFISRLVERTDPVPLLVVCAARPELLDRRPDWGGGTPDAVTISLQPLSKAGTTQLLASLLRGTRLAPATSEALIASAEGNPLFVEEYVRMLHDQDLVRATTAELPVPDTVQQLIAARLDTLEPGDKALVADAAVVGEVAWVGAVAALSGRQRAEVHAWLHRLERRELLRRSVHTTVAGEVEFAFRHVLIRDVAYQQLVRSARVDRHERAARWLAALGGDQPELVAAHYEQALELARAAGIMPAGLAEEARGAFHEAGARAYSLGAYDAVVRFYRAALELTPSDDPERPDLLLGLGRARSVRDGGGTEELTQARDALLDAGRPVDAALAEAQLARLAWARMHGEDRVRHIERAWELVADAPPSAAKARVLYDVANSLTMDLLYQRAVEVAQQALAAARAGGHTVIEGDTLRVLGLARAFGGEAEGLADLQRSIDVLEQERVSHVVDSYYNLAVSRISLGDVHGAAASLAETRDAAARYRVGLGDELWIDAEEASVCYWRGDWDRAATLIDWVLAHTAGDEFYREASCRVFRARMLAGRGELAAADAESARSLQLARQSRDGQLLPAPLGMRARLLLRMGRADQAAKLLDELLTGIGGKALYYQLGSDLPVALRGLGHAADALDGRDIRPTPWLDAARTLLAGEHGLAAERYAAIGSTIDEATARLLAGRQALADGRPEEALSQLQRASDVFRRAGASAEAAEAAEADGLLATLGAWRAPGGEPPRTSPA